MQHLSAAETLLKSNRSFPTDNSPVVILLLYETHIWFSSLEFWIFVAWWLYNRGLKYSSFSRGLPSAQKERHFTAFQKGCLSVSCSGEADIPPWVLVSRACVSVLPSRTQFSRSPWDLGGDKEKIDQTVCAEASNKFELYYLNSMQLMLQWKMSANTENLLF